MEIAEDEEEDNRKRQSTVMEELLTPAKSVSVSGAPESAADGLAGSASLPLPSTPSGLSISTGSASLFTEPPPPRSPTKSTDEAPPRKSTSSIRPDMYSFSSYGSNGKPKVKLGPRPSLDVSGGAGRPHTSGAHSYRPVSTLPAGLKMFSRGSRKGRAGPRPTSTYNAEPPSMTISPPPLPDMSQSTPTRPHTSGGRPPPSPNSSIKPTPPPITPNSKFPAITPEKARLMKALQMRKKQKQTTVPPAETQSPISSEVLTSPTVENFESRLSGAPKEVHDTLAMLNDMAKEDDSGIAFDASSALRTDESDATRSDSYPVSPVGPSERAESTRASSISDDTDETVQDVPVKPEPMIGKSPLEGNTSPMEVEKRVSGIQLLPLTYKPPKNTAARPEPVEEPEEEFTPVAVAIEQTPVDSATVEMAAEEQKLETLSDSVPEPVSQPKSMKDLHIPRSKFSMENLGRQDQAGPPTSPTKISNIPTSKFNTENASAADIGPENPTQPLPLAENRNAVSFPQKSPIGSTFSADSKRSMTEDDQENDGHLLKKRKKRKAIEPIRTDVELADISGQNSEANFSSDDDLMDELDSAVVQEAMPISVSKSPITPVFPSPNPNKRESWRNRVSRVVSTPTGGKETGSGFLGIPPKVDGSRSVSASAAFLNKVNQESTKPIATKVNVGSGIAQRLKALEKFSASPGAPPSSTPASGAAPAFFSVRKSNVRGTSPSIAERTNSLNKNTPSPASTTDVSPQSSPETQRIRDRSRSIKNRVSTFESNPIPVTPTLRSRPESISVTARIVRDPAQPFPQENGKLASEYAPLDLKQSPLVIDHQKAIPEPPREKETIQERRQSRERRLSSSSNATSSTVKNRRSSITIVRDLINEGRQSFADRRRSVEFTSSMSSPNIRSSSRPRSVMSPSKPPSAHVSSPMHKRTGSTSSRLSTGSRTPNDTLSPPQTAGSSSSTSDEKEKKSRTSRMLKRMSSTLSSGRKALGHAVSPTVREESEPLGNDSLSFASSQPSTPAPTPNINIGDVNVQFPDTLLWKRRSMLLDSRGYLILSPALAASGNGNIKGNSGAARKFHLSEFKMPSIPDVEMQELPNSVVLEFMENGAGGLQIACEDRSGQGRILEGTSAPFPSTIPY